MGANVLLMQKSWKSDRPRSRKLYYKVPIDKKFFLFYNKEISHRDFHPPLLPRDVALT